MQDYLQPVLREGFIEVEKRIFCNMDWNSVTLRKHIQVIVDLASFQQFRDDNLNLLDNQRIFAAVHTYTCESRRFT